MPRGAFDRSGRRARTRRQLLDAAARVYARQGFERATLDEVAEEAGFTKGAVYDHFGSKEKLLFALLDEHLSDQIVEQLALFDPAKASAERPRAGADRWIAELDENPVAFLLFVEAWVRGQRDESLRPQVMAGIEAWRETLIGFGRARTAETGLEVTDAVLERFANVMLGLGIGLGMVKLADPEGVPPELLGEAYAMLLESIERGPSAQAAVAGAAAAAASPDRTAA